ncbi:MAG: hypothetical protein K0R82_2817 [Flavipsychrobacter sp.]|nr:hypothetical protein [Flavipsychrobacter sp.]
MKKFFKYLAITLVVLLLLVGGSFLITRQLDNTVAENPSDYVSKWDAGKPMLVPSQFIEGERFYIKVPTQTGDTALAYGDSGGGMCMVNPLALDKLKLSDKTKLGLVKGVVPMKYLLAKDVLPAGLFPIQTPTRYNVMRRFFARVTEPLFLVPPVDDELKFINSVMNYDLFLGQNYFMDKAWTIDYPNRQIWVNTPLSTADSNVQPLGFKKNEHGEKIFGHPSMYIVVDGETIPVLFDTGATLVLSENGKKFFGTGEKTKGGSFIAASLFDKWRKQHPEWKYYPKADHIQDVIEVPTLTIGGQEVGPVLFAKRPDENWSQGMIHSMDKVVKGAIGGSGLKYLKVVIDYNAELVKFEKSATPLAEI